MKFYELIDFFERRIKPKEKRLHTHIIFVLNKARLKVNFVVEQLKS